jgi:hypothetical protein
MQSVAARLHPVASPGGSRVSHHQEDTGAETLHLSAADSRTKVLSSLQGIASFFVFVAWLALFGAGIMMDTAPYRAAISPEGARQLRAEGRAASDERERPPDPLIAANQPEAEGGLPGQRGAASGPLPGQLRSWAVVLLCFLPLNLAWLCVLASTLGAIGNLANLSDDNEVAKRSDFSNPIISAILRGFFVYLFLMSGLLLLDHAPFSNAGPSQYIRLAGFLSLFSFVVSYQPHLFGALIVSAFERIQVRAGDGHGGSDNLPNAPAQQRTTIKSVEVESTSVATVAKESVPIEREESSNPTPPLHAG